MDRDTAMANDNEPPHRSITLDELADALGISVDETLERIAKVISKREEPLR